MKSFVFYTPWYIHRFHSGNTVLVKNERRRSSMDETQSVILKIIFIPKHRNKISCKSGENNVEEGIIFQKGGENSTLFLPHNKGVTIHG